MMPIFFGRPRYLDATARDVQIGVPSWDPAYFNYGVWNDNKKDWTNVQPDGYYLEPLYQFSWLDRGRISHKIHELENGSTDPVRVYRVTLQLNLFRTRQMPDCVYPDDQV